MASWLGHANFFVAILTMMAGFYVTMASPNLVKKLIGLSLFQLAALILYVTSGMVAGGRAPILAEGVAVYSNPIPHVLMLTAIVVGIATLAVGLAIAIRIKEAYHTIEEDELQAIDAKTELGA